MKSADDARLRQLLRLSYVRRWSVVPTKETQSVAEHTFNMLALANWYFDVNDVADEEYVCHTFRVILEHDRLESVSGDVPSPAQKYMALPPDELDRPTFPDVAYLVKVFDLIEAVLFISAQQARGDTTVDLVYNELYNKVKAMLRPLPWAKGEVLPIYLLHKLELIADPSIHPVMEFRG